MSDTIAIVPNFKDIRMRRLILALACLLPIVSCADSRVTLVASGPPLDKPFGVDRGPDGTLYVVDFAAHQLHALPPNGKLATICGSTKGDSGDGGPAADAKLNSPHAIAVDTNGDVYIADTLNHRIRKIDAKTRVIATVAGTTKGYGGDGGPADKAQFSGIFCIAFNPDHSKLVITDLENRRIRVMDMKSHVVTTVAGNGKRGEPAPGGRAVEQPLLDPRAATMDSKGSVYVLERNGGALRVVDPAGVIRTLIPAAAKGQPGTLAGPKHLSVDAHDDVYIADTDHHRIVKWLAKEGKLVPIAGTGKVGSAGVDGPPNQLQLSQPHGVFATPQGLYIADSFNGRVLFLPNAP